MKYLNALFTIDGVGNQKISLLLNHFETAEQAWRASASELIEAGILPKLADLIVEKRKSIDPAELCQQLKKENIVIITIKDENYPELLKQIPAPP